MKRPRRTKTKLLLGAGTAACCLAILELVCRIASPRPVDARLPAKPEGCYRILALGGSTVEGFPAPSMGFVRQLEAGLRVLEPDRRVEVLNLGAGATPSSYVLRRLEHTIDAKPDLVIVLTAHNEFLNRPDGDSAGSELGGLLEELALTRVLRKAVYRVYRPQPPREHILPDRLVPHDRKSAWFRSAVEKYRANLAAIVKLTQSHGVPLFLCTAPCNLADWPPVHRRIAWAMSNPRYDEDLSDIKALIADERYQDARAAADSRLRKYGEDAMALYLKAKAYQRLERHREALELFVRAKDRDPYPWRGLSEFNDLVRSLGGRKRVRVVDLARTLERHAKGGAVGFELVSDNVHPTPLGNAIIAGELIREMADAGCFVAPGARLGAPEAWLRRFSALSGKASYGNLLDVAYLIANATYAMRPPFYHYDIARDYLERARKLAPNRWQIWANLATVDVLEGNTEDGIEKLGRARQLKGAALDLDDRVATPYLKEALEEAGIDAESFQ